MRARTVFLILLVLILLVALEPALIALISQEIAERVVSCEVNLNDVVPCVIRGENYGQTFYDLGFAIWHSYLSMPAGLVLLALWGIAAAVVYSVGSTTAGARHPTPKSC
jgi:hypothetical protein